MRSCRLVIEVIKMNRQNACLSVSLMGRFATEHAVRLEPPKKIRITLEKGVKNP